MVMIERVEVASVWRLFKRERGCCDEESQIDVLFDGLLYTHHGHAVSLGGIVWRRLISLYDRASKTGGIDEVERCRRGPAGLAVEMTRSMEASTRVRRQIDWVCRRDPCSRSGRRRGTC